MSCQTKLYIGDGVFASYDGYQIELTVYNGSGLPTNTIYLDPHVWATLKQYVESLRPKNQPEIEDSNKHEKQNVT